MDELARQPRHGPNYNQLLHLLNDLQNHQSAWPFVHPVNRDEVADYYEVIKEPMDLSTMEEKHEKDLYPNPEDFIRDAKLIFDNCRKYNNETTPYAKSANRLEKFMWAQIKLIPEWSVRFLNSRDFLSRFHASKLITCPGTALGRLAANLIGMFRCSELGVGRWCLSRMHLTEPAGNQGVRCNSEVF